MLRVGLQPLPPGVGAGLVAGAIVELHIPGGSGFECLEIHRPQPSTASRQRVIALIRWFFTVVTDTPKRSAVAP